MEVYWGRAQGVKTLAVMDGKAMGTCIDDPLCQEGAKLCDVRFVLV